VGGLNPYYLGFKLFQHIEETKGIEECFIAREASHDVSFLRQYLTRDLCEELGLFTYSDKGKKEGVTIDEISDEDGWESVKLDLLKNVGTNSIPVIYIDEVEDDLLVLRHEHDGRDLELNHAEAVVGHVSTLWNKESKLFTIIEEELWEV
jgi:stage V sporulation protein R